MRKYKGYIVENNTIIGQDVFVIFGQMSDGMKCYCILDEYIDENITKWYSRRIVKYNGRQYNIFSVEGV